MADSPSKVNHGLMGWQPTFRWKDIHNSLFYFKWRCQLFNDIMVLADALHMGIDSKGWNTKAHTYDYIGRLTTNTS